MRQPGKHLGETEPWAGEQLSAGLAFGKGTAPAEAGEGGGCPQALEFNLGTVVRAGPFAARLQQFGHWTASCSWESSVLWAYPGRGARRSPLHHSPGLK